MATLGKLTDGASSSGSSANKTAVSKFTAGAAGTVTDGHARCWLSATGTATTRVVIYADSGGAPGALLAQSDALVISNTSEAQNDYTFSGADQISIISGVDYWVGLSWQDPGSPSLSLSRNNTASGRRETSAYLPNPFGSPTAQTGPVDVYVDLTTSSLVTGSASAALGFTATATGASAAAVPVTEPSGSARIDVHPNSPPRVDGAVASSTATTASFDAPAGTVLVALVIANSSSGGTTTAAITNNGAALTWTAQSVVNFPVSGVSGYAGIFTAPLPADRAALTCTVTTAGSTSTTRRPSLRVLILTGVDESDILVDTVQRWTTANAWEGDTFRSEPDSLEVVVACEWQKRGAPTGSGAFDSSEGFDQASSPGVSGLTGYWQGGPADRWERYGADGFGDSACAWNIARIEIRADLSETPAGFRPLPNQLPDTWLQVEAAFGADLTDIDGTSWEWTDITADVRQAPGINIQLGRGDEAGTAQPASLTCTLDNDEGDYSAGPLGANWPNVKVGVPIRARLFVAGSQVADTLFQGYAAAWTPAWGLTGGLRTVQLEASGILRRLQQGAAPVQSALRRSLADNGKTIAYWPCEDGKLATILAPAVGSVGMRFGGGPPKLASVEAAECSAPIIALNGATLAADLPPYPASAKNQVRALFVFPDSDVAADGIALMSIYTSGTIARWDVQFKAGGHFRMATYDRFGALIAASTTYLFGVNGETRLYDITLEQVGAAAEWTVGTLRPYSLLGQNSDTITSQTIGNVIKVEINPSGAATDLAAGHVAVMNDAVGRFAVQSAVNAWAGDFASAVWNSGRPNRLGRENGLVVQVLYGDTPEETPLDRLGPQSIVTLVELLRDIEQVDQGILYDGQGPGVTYVDRRYIETRSAALTIDAAAREMSPPFGLTDDDQRVRNRVTATRDGGSSATVEDADGPLGTGQVGVYDESVTAALYTDEAAPLLAGWLVSLGTVEGYRYPRVTVDLQANPHLAAAALAVRPGQRIDITGLSTVLPFHPPGDVRLLVEGIEHDFGAATWQVTFVCSPYAPWAVGLAAADTGSTGEFVARAADDGHSSLASSAGQGATTLSVATAAGYPLWTTVADDFPFDVLVGGVPVTVTAVSGAASPQTFTTTALPDTRPAGASVELANPTTAGL